MSLTGKGTLSLRKKDVQQQKQAGAAYRRVVFAHKASAGESGINLTALIQPSEMAALGFTNPSTADLLAANMLFYKKNLTVISSARGTLMQDLSYTVPTSTRIEFQGFTALQDEIFTCLLETGVRDGLSIVDASPIIATGELAIGDTDFNVGIPFEVNKYSTQQVGSVLVFRNGTIQFRNPSNSTSGGNYQEVDNGSGLGTIIRFNNAPVGQPDNIVVWGNLLAERPDGSMMAAIESLAGQLDQMIPTLAALAGVPENTFQAAPNNQDLKSFGDSVGALLNVEVPIFQEYAALGHSGFSSNNLYIPVLGTVRYNRGAAIGTINNTAADGWSFTALVDCNLQISFSAGSNSGFGFSVNPSASEMDNPVFNLAGTAKLYGYTSLNSSGLNVSAAMIPLVAGDVVRLHSQDLITSPNVNMSMIATARSKLKDLAGL